MDYFGEQWLLGCSARTRENSTLIREEREPLKQRSEPRRRSGGALRRSQSAAAAARRRGKQTNVRERYVGERALSNELRRGSAELFTIEEARLVKFKPRPVPIRDAH